MNAGTMMRRCVLALHKLDKLEQLLSYIPAYREADRFTYTSIGEVRELHHIAKLETIHTVTVEQTSHIQRILSKVDFFLNLVPNAAKRELDGGADTC